MCWAEVAASTQQWNARHSRGGGSMEAAVDGLDFLRGRRSKWPWAGSIAELVTHIDAQQKLLLKCKKKKNWPSVSPEHSFIPDSLAKWVMANRFSERLQQRQELCQEQKNTPDLFTIASICCFHARLDSNDFVGCSLFTAIKTALSQQASSALLYCIQVCLFAVFLFHFIHTHTACERIITNPIPSGCEKRKMSLFLTCWGCFSS